MRGGPADRAGLVAVTSSRPRRHAAGLDQHPDSVLDRHYPGDVLDLTWIDGSGQTRTGKVVLTPGVI